jgi:uncharacterized protein (TIGR00661 family)
MDPYPDRPMVSETEQEKTVRLPTPYFFHDGMVFSALSHWKTGYLIFRGSYLRPTTRPIWPVSVVQTTNPSPQAVPPAPDPQEAVVGPSALPEIFYGVQATGNGHIYRYRGIAAGLRDAGWPITSIAVGQEQFARPAGTTHWSHGLSFDVSSHGIHFTHTLGHALQDLPGYLRQTEYLAQLMEECSARAVICDFEPLSSRAALDTRTPLLIVDNQTSVFCRSRRSGKHRALVQLARLFTTFWYGPKSIAGCHSVVTVSLSPEQPGLDQQLVVPPPVRHEILSLHPVRGNHAVLYTSFGTIPEELLQAASTTHRDLEIRIHVPHPPGPEVQIPPNILIRQAPSLDFLEDIRTAGAIIAQAGFMTSAEAALLGKPVAMVPLHGQFEQILNGLEFERLGVGCVFQDYGAPLLDWVRENRNQSRTAPELQTWLGNGVDSVVSALNRCLERAVGHSAQTARK